MPAELVGQSLAQFLIVEELAKGGMGVVYRARDSKLERDVALKVIHPELSEDPHYRRRLTHEAKAAAAISHPGIATVYQIDEDNGLLFIAMELAKGLTLADMLKDGPMPVERVLSIGIEVARALEKAHQAGVIHRDLKPENIVVCDDGHTKVLDFGIARKEVPESARADKAEADTALTAEGTVLGTPGYMSPEQALGLDVDARTDIFSLGVVLYEMLAGKRPFVGNTLMESAIAVTRDEAPPVSSHRPRIPAALESVIEHCLEKGLDDRLASASELEVALENAFDEVGVPLPSMPARPRTNPGSRASASTTRESAIEGRLPVETPVAAPAAGARRLWWLGVALAALIAGGIWWRTTRVEGPAPAASVSASANTSTSASAVPLTALPLPDSKSPEAVAAYRKALNALRDANWTLTEELLREAVKHDPSMAAAHLRLAIITNATHRKDIAREHLQKAALERASLSDRDQQLLRVAEPLAGRAHVDTDAALKALRVAIERFPTDAEFFFLLSATLMEVARIEESIAAAKRAVALDPEYSDALQLLGVALIKVGRWEQAAEALDGCVNASPTTVDCVLDLAMIQAFRGECAKAVKLGELAMTRAPAHSWGSLLRASAMVATGEPLAAAEQVLQRASKKYAAPTRELETERGRYFVAAMRGDFVAAERALRAMYLSPKGPGDRKLRADRERLLLGLETGASATVIALARAHHKERGLQPAEGPEARSFPLPLVWRQLSVAGKLTADEQLKLRQRWLSAWKKRKEADDGILWVGAFALPARTKEEAQEALKQRPADFEPRKYFRRDNFGLVDGVVHQLAGEHERAAPILETAVRDCMIVNRPLDWVQARAALAQVYEARGENAKACSAYRAVLERWGSAKPRSITAEHARERVEELACKP